MRFDLKKFFLTGLEPYSVEFEPDLSAQDFPGFSVPKPPRCAFHAELDGDDIQMELRVQGCANGECARCLAPVEQEFTFTRAYTVRERDLQDKDAELPLDEKGRIDLEELVYQEIIFEVPPVLRCSRDCTGLCPICGKKKAAGCTCQPAENAATVDVRLSILKNLLN